METKEKEILELIKEIGDLPDDKAERIMAFYQYQEENLSDDDDLRYYLEDLCNSFDPETNTIAFDNGEEYLILTDAEADEKAKEEILNSLEYFMPGFLSCHIGIDDEEAIRAIQQTKNANEVIKKLIDANSNIDDFIEEAESADGRGHFISIYDGNEYEEQVNKTWYYIYRIN